MNNSGERIAAFGASNGSAAFAEVTIVAPNLSLRFKATPERIRRVLEVVLKEARESEAEYEQSLKSKPSNADLKHSR